VEAFLYFIWHITGQDTVAHANFFAGMPQWWQYGLPAAFTGALLAVVLKRGRKHQPFPFGPALAVGAFIAMFLDPFSTAGR
jgi:prepilin signal peptidase PulO-like enzyme (type II secretory pathway)